MGVVGLLMLGACSKTGQPDHTGIYQEIKSGDKMVFASMAITKTARMESADWYTIGKRIAVIPTIPICVHTLICLPCRWTT